MKTQGFYLRIILLLLLVLSAMDQSGCNQLGPYKRNNTYDPAAIDFKPESADSLYALVRGDSVKLYWRDQSNHEQGYLIERKLGKNKKFQTLHRLPPNSESYTDVINSKPFWVQYRVTPYVQSGDSLRGRSIQTAYLPFIPFNTVIPKLKELSETKTRISWPLLYSKNISYIIERMIKPKDNQGTSHEVFIQLDTLGNGVDSYVDSLALSSSIYREYKVIPFFDGEEGPVSQILTLIPVPVTPRNFTLGKNGTDENHITLKWKASSLCDGFHLEIRPEGGDWKALASLGPDNRSYTQTLPDTTISYSFRINSLTSDYTPPLTLSDDSTLIKRKHRDISDGRYLVMNHAEDIIYYVTGRYSDTRLVAWNWRDNKELFSTSFPNSIDDIAITPDDSKLLVAFGSDIGDFTGGLYLIDANTGTTGKALSNTSTYLTAISPDGQDYVTFLTTSIQIRRISDNALVYQDSLNQWGGGYSGVAFDPKAPYIAIQTEDGHIEIHNLDTKARVRIWGDFSPGFTHVVDYDSQGKYLFNVGQILDPVNGTVKTTFHFQHFNNDAAIGPADRIYAVWHYHSGYVTGDKDGISVYNLNGSLWRDFETYDGNMSHVVSSDVGNLVATISADGIDVWTIGKRWRVVPGQ